MISQQCSIKSLVETKEGSSISVYNDELTNKGLVSGIAKIKGAFPTLPLEFFDIISDRFIEKGFTDERIKDSVNYVIDNCQYPTPAMAQFLSFDKRRKLYTYHEMLQKINDAGGDIFKYYNKEKINGIMYWFKKEE